MHKTGKTSLYGNLPHPKIIIISEHAYVSFIEIISDALAHNLSVATCHDGMEKEPLEIKFMRWSDDFEPSTGIKANRGNGIWISTVTLLSSIEKNESVYNTYILAIGSKGGDHNLVEYQFQSDLKSINDHKVMFYSKYENKKVKVTVSMVAYLADSPERHTLCSLTRGNGNYTLRWGYLFDKRYIIDCLPACNKCLSAMKKGISACNIHCKKCLNWDISNTNHKLTYFPSPENYPDDLNDLRNGKLQSKKITFLQLKEVCALTHEKIKKGKWKSKQANSYMQVNGINEILREAIINDADEVYVMTQDGEFHEDKLNGLPGEVKRNLFEKKILPAIWDIQEGITSMPDVPMHLLFLNVTKSTVHLILDWCTFTNNDRRRILKHFEEIFEALYELKLEWMKILPLRTSSFGGWVSENWLAFGRILCWAFSTINDMESSLQLEEQMKTREQKKWTKMMNKYWLQSRSLDIDGLAVELRERVATFMKDDNCPQKLLKNKVVLLKIL